MNKSPFICIAISIKLRLSNCGVYILIFLLISLFLGEVVIEKLGEKIADSQKKLIRIKEELAEEGEVDSVNDIYVTFRSPKIAKDIRTAYSKSKCRRCCIICFCRKKTIENYYYKNKWLKIEQAKDEPSNINWRNVTYNKCKIIKMLPVIASTVI